MSAFTHEINRAARWAEEQAERKAKPKARKAPPANVNEALRTLSSKSATEADKLRAWLCVGYDLGAIDLRDASRLGAVTR